MACADILSLNQYSYFLGREKPEKRPHQTMFTDN